MKLNSFLDDCIYGRTDNIKQFFGKFLQKFEDRATNVENKIIKGFGALHYAIFNKHHPLVKALLDANAPLQTKERYEMPFKMFPESEKLILDEGADALSIAVAVDDVESAKLIIDHYKKNTKLFGLCTKIQSNALQTAITLNNDCAKFIVTNRDLMLLQLQQMDCFGYMAFHHLCWMKRIVLLQLILNHYKDDMQIMKLLKISSLVLTNDGETTKALSREHDESIWGKLGITEQDMIQTIKEVAEFAHLAYYEFRDSVVPEEQFVVDQYARQMVDDDLQPIVRNRRLDQSVYDSGLLCDSMVEKMKLNNMAGALVW